MSGYNSGPFLEYCPNVRTNMTFFARDVFNNKIDGEFLIRIYIDNVEKTDYLMVEPGQDPSEIMQGEEELPRKYFFWLKKFPYSIGTTNKELTFDLMKPMTAGDYYLNGFRLASDNIRFEVKFRVSSFFPWTTKNFYFKSSAIAPSPAYVSGADAVSFCSGGEIKVLEFDDIPVDANKPDYCYWHHKWVWELPVGWKVTGLDGNLNTADNKFTGGTSVKVQAPPLFLAGSETLTVKSEDAWPYPISTTTTIFKGKPTSPKNIGYGFNPDVPQTICYDATLNSGDFYAELSTSTLNTGTTFEWQTNAGSLANSITSLPSNSVVFTNPGINRYIRVRAINDCGVSSWYTQDFDLEYQAFGCSGDGIGGFSLLASPNPSDDNLTVELSSEESRNNRTTPESDLRIILMNSEQEVVIDERIRVWKRTFPLNRLPKGRYVLNVIYKKEKYAKHILIK